MRYFDRIGRGRGMIRRSSDLPSAVGARLYIKGESWTGPAGPELRCSEIGPHSCRFAAWFAVSRHHCHFPPALTPLITSGRTPQSNLQPQSHQAHTPRSPTQLLHQHPFPSVPYSDRYAHTDEIHKSVNAISPVRVHPPSIPFPTFSLPLATH